MVISDCRRQRRLASFRRATSLSFYVRRKAAPVTLQIPAFRSNKAVCEHLVDSTPRRLKLIYLDLVIICIRDMFPSLTTSRASTGGERLNRIQPALLGDQGKRFKITVTDSPVPPYLPLESTGPSDQRTPHDISAPHYHRPDSSETVSKSKITPRSRVSSSFLGGRNRSYDDCIVPRRAPLELGPFGKCCSQQTLCPVHNGA